MLRNNRTKKSFLLRRMLDVVESALAPVSTTASFYHSTKLTKLVKDLKTFGADKQTKIMVFSQWTHMLDVVESALALENIRNVRFDGKLKRKSRE